MNPHLRPRAILEWEEPKMSKKWLSLSLVILMIVGLFFFGCSKKSTTSEGPPGDGSPPAAPSLVSPVHGATGVAASVNLSWNTLLRCSGIYAQC